MHTTLEAPTASDDHLSILALGVDFWNRWRRENPSDEPQLAGAILRGANLIGVDLHEANLFRADLRGAHLAKADFSSASLIAADLRLTRLFGIDAEAANFSDVTASEADFRGADLRRTNFYRADLSAVDLGGADLSDANLGRSDLSDAILRDANLSHANLNRASAIDADFQAAVLSFASLSRTVLSGANLENAKGLEFVIQPNPCIIDIETILHSQLPKIFLSHAGVPNKILELLIPNPANHLIFSEGPLTSHLLSTKVGPFLNAITQMQYVIDCIKNVQPKRVLIKSLLQNSPIEVNLDGASDAIEQINEVIVPWKSEHAKEMARLLQLAKLEEIKNLEGDLLEKKSRAASTRAEADRISAEAEKLRAEAAKMRIENENLRLQLYQRSVELALGIIERVGPTLSESEKLAWVVKLLEPLRLITEIDFPDPIVRADQRRKPRMVT